MTEAKSPLDPVWGDLGIPEVDDAEPENAVVEHLAPPEELE